MAITKDKKKEVWSRLKSIFDESGNVTFVNFHGMSVADSNTLRSKLRESNVNFYVAKKSLIRKVLEGTKTEGELPALDGELGLAYGADKLAPSQEVFSLRKTLDDKVSLLGGIFEGKFMDKSEIENLASIPKLPVLHGQFVNIINSPIQRFVIALGEISKSKS